MIKFTDVSFGFPQKDLYNEICFEIVEGDHAALIGSNGTGKSTLIDMIINPFNKCLNNLLMRHKVAPL